MTAHWRPVSLFASVVLAAVAWLAPMPSAVAVQETWVVSVYTCDTAVYDAPENSAADGRGPPLRTNTYRYTTYDAVDLRSPGIFARLSGPGHQATYDYGSRARFVQSAIAAGTTKRPAGAHGGPLTVFPGSMVAANTAEGAADAALAAGRTSGAAAELNVGGQVLTDVSTGGASRSLNPAVQAALDDVPMGARAPWHGACAEMGCLSQAIDRGINPSGGSIRAVAIGESNPGHGLPKAICSSCQNVLARFGVTW